MVKEKQTELIRIVGYICMTPRSRATSTVLENRRCAFEDLATTSHWPELYLVTSKRNQHSKYNPNFKLSPSYLLISFFTCQTIVFKNVTSQSFPSFCFQSDGGNFCGGSLIGPRLVVTAAHWWVASSFTFLSKRLLLTPTILCILFQHIWFCKIRKQCPHV